MTNRIDRRFEALAGAGRAALIPFVTVGDPDPDWTAGIMHALVESGSDLLELGVPFSDPAADGPVIQLASERAIERGVTLQGVLDTVRTFREKDADTPVVLMGYLNPIERYGHAEFARDASAAGVDGILMVDCPPEEMVHLRGELDEHGIYPICLVAPTTTPERMERISRQAGGYLYYVSFKGITGADQLQEASLEQPLHELRSHTGLPVAVGFGIKDAQSAAAVARLADGVVIGSALIEQLADAPSEAAAQDRVRDFLAPIRKAMDNSRR
ncbi:MAG: tryptophan synthase subunit alpha [Xanthomonadales bacterium]|nr:tryptophan synthase subunit alpha [Xanthomonadales bacterium]